MIIILLSSDTELFLYVTAMFVIDRAFNILECLLRLDRPIQYLIQTFPVFYTQDKLEHIHLLST